jgi:hypothetical protein
VLYGLVEQTGLSDTTVIVHGRIPTRNAPIVAGPQAPEGENGPPPFLAPLAATLSSIFGTTSTR